MNMPDLNSPDKLVLLREENAQLRKEKSDLEALLESLHQKAHLNVAESQELLEHNKKVQRRARLLLWMAIILIVFNVADLIRRVIPYFNQP